MEKNKYQPGHCMFCGKKVGPLRTKGGLSSRGMVITHADPKGLFCTERCAAYYGVWIAEQVVLKLTGE